MRRRRPPSRVSVDPLGAAGWLFAELALILVIIVLGAEVPRRPPPPTTPPPTTSATEKPGLSLRPRAFCLDVPENASGVGDGFQAGVEREVRADERVGLVLLFGHSRSADALAGTVVARQAMDAIGTRPSPHAPEKAHIRAYSGPVERVPDGTEVRGYLGGDCARGQVNVELFVLTGAT